MPIPDLFTPFALSAGILTNITTDALKHHAQAIEGTSMPHEFAAMLRQGAG